MGDLHQGRGELMGGRRHGRMHGSASRAGLRRTGRWRSGRGRADLLQQVGLHGPLSRVLERAGLVCASLVCAALGCTAEGQTVLGHARLQRCGRTGRGIGSAMLRTTRPRRSGRGRGRRRGACQVGPGSGQWARSGREHGVRGSGRRHRRVDGRRGHRRQVRGRGWRGRRVRGGYAGVRPRRCRDGRGRPDGGWRRQARRTVRHDRHGLPWIGRGGGEGGCGRATFRVGLRRVRHGRVRGSCRGFHRLSRCAIGLRSVLTLGSCRHVLAKGDIRRHGRLDCTGRESTGRKSAGRGRVARGSGRGRQPRCGRRYQAQRRQEPREGGAAGYGLGRRSGHRSFLHDLYGCVHRTGIRQTPCRRNEPRAAWRGCAVCTGSGPYAANYAGRDMPAGNRLGLAEACKTGHGPASRPGMVRATTQPRCTPGVRAPGWRTSMSSLFGALDTAVSGLSAQSSAFSNISDNVANSQTTGFKGTDTNFVDYLTNSTAATNDSGFVVGRPGYRNDVLGTIASSDQPAGARHLRATASSRSRRRPPMPRARRSSAPRRNTPGTAISRSTRTATWSTTRGRAERLGGRPDHRRDQRDHGRADQGGPDGASARSPRRRSRCRPTFRHHPRRATPVSSQVNVYDAKGTMHTVSLTWTQNASDDWTVAVNARTRPRRRSAGPR